MYILIGKRCYLLLWLFIVCKFSFVFFPVLSSCARHDASRATSSIVRCVGETWRSSLPVKGVFNSRLRKACGYVSASSETLKYLMTVVDQITTMAACWSSQRKLPREQPKLASRFQIFMGRDATIKQYIWYRLYSTDHSLGGLGDRSPLARSIDSLVPYFLLIILHVQHGGCYGPHEIEF